MSKETKEQIKQRIQRERGEYTKARRKRYLHFKNIGRLDLYYNQKIPMMPKLGSVVAGLTFWERVYVALVLLFKKAWRKITGKN